MQTTMILLTMVFLPALKLNNKNNRIMKYLGRLFRIIVGIVFIFSGFVKSVDPYGTAYKITEYMGVFGLGGLIQAIPWLPITISVILCSLEFVIGLLLISGYLKKSTNWIVGIMMLFFTVLTFIDALTNKVTDCGCFGDAVKLTNWQTFWKNIILDVLLVLSFLWDKFNLKLKTNHTYGRFYLILVSFLVLSFTIFNAIYEPMIDFRPWKEGNRMVPLPEDQKPPVSYATYRNNSTNKEREFGMEELMQAYKDDPNFATNWTFVNSRVINTNTIAADGFSMIGVVEQKDVAFDFLSYQGVSFIVTIVDLDVPSEKTMKKVVDFLRKASMKRCQTAVITASPVAKWAEFTKKHNMSGIIIYSTDDKAIMTIMRSNPGIVMIKNGQVIKKYPWRLLPPFENITLY